MKTGCHDLKLQKSRGKWYLVRKANSTWRKLNLGWNSYDIVRSYWSTRPTHSHSRQWSLFSHVVSVRPSVRLFLFFKSLQKNYWWVWPRGSLWNTCLVMGLCQVVWTIVQILGDCEINRQKYKIWLYKMQRIQRWTCFNKANSWT